MAKNKQQKAKDRERRVAQKKLAEAEKRTTESAKKSQQAGQKVNKLASGVPHPVVDNSLAKPKHSFIRRRSMG